MESQEIRNALDDISADKDPALKSLKLASLCSALCRERGIELVVVGGSAIELLTDGAYTSGDLDFCLVTPLSLSARLRQEIMGRLGAQGGPRSWRVAGMFVDLLGAMESLARTPFRKLMGPWGEVQIAQPEELLVERVLVSDYPQPDKGARDCAKKLAAVALGGALELDWNELKRLASLPEYRNLAQCRKLVGEVASELRLKNPFDTAA